MTFSLIFIFILWHFTRKNFEHLIPSIIQCIQRLPILVLIASQTMTTKNKSKFLLFYLTRYRPLLFLFIFIMNSLINYVFNTCNKKKFWRKKNCYNKIKYRGFPFDIWTNFKDGPTLTDEVNARKVYFQAVVLEFCFYCSSSIPMCGCTANVGVCLCM